MSVGGCKQHCVEEHDKQVPHVRTGEQGKGHPQVPGVTLEMCVFVPQREWESMWPLIILDKAAKAGVAPSSILPHTEFYGPCVIPVSCCHRDT